MQIKSSKELIQELRYFLATGEEEGCITLAIADKGKSRAWNEGIQDFYRRIGEAYFRENMTPYIMSPKSKHYHSLCGVCKVRVSMGKKFVIDPIDSKVIYHLACSQRKKK